MDPEDNAITIPYTGAHTLTSTLNVDGTFLTYTGGSSLSCEPIESKYRDNSDGKIVIPAPFETILKKFIEGLESVRVVEYESYKNTNYDTLVSDDTIFYLHVELKISWDVKQLYTKKDYTEKINDLFKMTYPNNNSYKFEVKNVIGGQHDKHKEFFEFFSR